MLNSRKTQIAIVISLIIGAFYQYFSVLDIDSSLAITSMDDGPVIPYLLSQRFDLFYEDAWSVSWWQLRWTSASKWIPALLGYLDVDISRQYLQIFFLAFQGMFLTLGVFVLSFSVVKSRKLALTLVLLFCLTRPHFNNWAFYGDQEFMPYVTWLALGPLMTALGLKILNKNGWSIFFIAVGSSMHVSMGIVFGLAIFGLSCFQDYKNSHKIILFKNSLQLLGPLIFLILGYLSIISISVNYDTTAEKVALLSNQHFRAWILNPNEKSYLLSVQSLLMALLLSGIVYGIASLYNAKDLYSYDVFFKFNITTNFAYYLLQAVFYILGITKLASVSWGRISLILVISLYIVIIDIVYKQIILKARYNFQDRIVLIATLGICVLGSKMSMSLFLLLIVIFIFRKNVVKSRLLNRNRIINSEIVISSILLLSAVLSLGIIDLRYIEIAKQSWNVISSFNGLKTIIFLFHELIVENPQSYLSNILPLNYFYFILIVILILFIVANKKILASLSIVISLFVGFVGLQNKILETQNRNIRYLSYKDVQLWAKDNSDEDETFVVEMGTSTYGAWGSLAERPRLITAQFEGQQYLYTQKNKLRNLEARFLLSEINSKKIVYFTDEYYLLFHKIRDFNYIVQKNDEIKIKNMVKVYENEEYTVFRI